MLMAVKQFSYQIGAELKTVTVEQAGDRFRVSIGDKVYDVAARQQQPGEFDLVIDGQQQRVHTASNGSHRYVAVAGGTWMLEKPRPRQQRHHGTHAGDASSSIEATMPGLVREVLAVEGTEVKRGDTLVVLEAMKMELRLSAPCNGRVGRVHCTTGQVVERGQVLVELEGDGSG